MAYNKVYITSFSPTRNTMRMAFSVAKGLGFTNTPTVVLHNTEQRIRGRYNELGANEILIAGCPSYYGRLPMVNPPVFGNIVGNNTTAIIFVTYGNIDYEDSLIEMRDLLKGKGFNCIAAGAFVTGYAHSNKIGLGRPNDKDYEMAIELGKMARQKIDNNSLSDNIDIKGNNPYKEFPMPEEFSPVANDTCVHCNLCSRLCPVNAINEFNPKITEEYICIHCHGCVTKCPMEAREVIDKGFFEKVNMLDEKFQGNNLESEIFY